MDSRKRLDFRLRASLVYDAIANWKIPLSMKEIAATSGLARSPYLKEIMNALVEGGFVQKGLDVTSDGRPVIVYWADHAPND